MHGSRTLEAGVGGWGGGGGGGDSILLLLHPYFFVRQPPKTIYASWKGLHLHFKLSELILLQSPISLAWPHPHPQKEGLVDSGGVRQGSNVM